MTRADWNRVHGISNEQALDAIEDLEKELEAAKELLALYHPAHEYPEHHLCPGCVFLGR